MDIIEFTKQYSQYHDPVKGEWCTKTNPQQYEKDFLNSLENNRFTISLFSRQMYGTTLMAIHIAYSLIFENKKIGICSPKLDMSSQILIKVKKIIQNYIDKNPFSVKIFDETKRMISLTNGGAVKIISGAMGSCGHEFDSFYIDQAAFVDDLKNLMAALFVICKSIHMISSPNGLNHFFNIYYDGSRKCNLFETGKYHYSLNSRSTLEWISQMKNIIQNDNLWRQDMELEFLSVDRPMNKMIQFRVTTELYDKIEIKAYENRLSISDYLRKLIDADLHLQVKQ